MSWVEGVNGFHSNIICFEAPFDGFPSNLKLLKNSIGNMLKSIQMGLQRSQKVEFYKLEILSLGDP